MSSLNTLTGRNGKLSVDATLVARTTQWGVNPTLATSSEWGDSDSGGYTNRAAGRRDAPFTAEGKYDTTNGVFDLFQPEDVCAVVLYLVTDGANWTFPRALCLDFNLVVNIDNEEIIGWTSGWGPDGDYTKP